jgi:hypothetical protein
MSNLANTREKLEIRAEPPLLLRYIFWDGRTEIRPSLNIGYPSEDGYQGNKDIPRGAITGYLHTEEIITEINTTAKGRITRNAHLTQPDPDPTQSQ